MTTEIWQEIKTGKVVFIYEKVEQHFVRGQLNFKSDLGLQDHFQMDWSPFIKTHVYVGKLEK